ncbi:MAG: alkaline phosphatase family protein [Gammaproteobacteria bacterium]|nr:alkaline phosphatase family protein [Gammaproteobacteria bacterium]
MSTPRLIFIIAGLTFQLTQLNFADPVLFSPAQPMPSAELDSQTIINRIAIGSCAEGDKDQTIFSTILQQHPDIFLFTGDNVYAATEQDDASLHSLKKAYYLLAQSEPFAQLRQQVPILATWDDHDYGLNDAGGNWPHKTLSESLFEYVWAIPPEAPVRHRQGVYQSKIIGPKNHQVQVILLDTRFFRTPLTVLPEPDYHGPYQASLDPEQTLLGEQQWAWLALQLAIPAQVRIIVSSIQILAEGHHWEAWQLLPKERSRLFELLRHNQSNNVILVSGDRHLAALYRDDSSLETPLWELTSSSLNVPLSGFKTDIQTEPGPKRIGLPFYDANFALLEINWEHATLDLQIRNIANETVRQAQVKLKLPGIAPL